MHVYNLENSNGNKVANQFVIQDGNIQYFQSYNTIIAKLDWDKCKVYLDSNYWNYSTTTSRFRNIFLGETRNETEKKIKSKEYILTDLNADSPFRSKPKI